jgi:hypothetical protein
MLGVAAGLSWLYLAGERTAEDRRTA